MAKKKIGKINTEDLEMFGNGGYTTGPIATHADSVLNYKNSKAQEAAFKAIKMETIDLATFKGIRKMIKDKYPDDPRIENINPNVVHFTSKPTLPTNHEYGVLQIKGEPPMPSIKSTPKPLPTPKPKPRPTTPSVTAPIIRAVDKIKSVVNPSDTTQVKKPRQLVYGNQPIKPIVEDKPTPGYMDTRGVMMDKPQTAGNYTPEQLLKMGYRAKQSNVTLPNSKMKYGKGGSTDLSWFNQKLVQEANTRMNSTTKTSLGKDVSTPTSRAYANRAKKLSANPEKYTNQDYIAGHKEEGLGNGVLSDPIAMAGALTAGGVGYGAIGLSQIPRMFGTNLIDQMTFGVNPLGALKNLKQEALYRGINPVGYGAKQKALDFFPNLVKYSLNPESKIRDIGLELYDAGTMGINQTLKQKFAASLAHKNANSYYDLPYEEAMTLFHPGEVSEILQKGKNRSDAFRIGLGLNQQHQTFDKIGNNLYRINPDKFNPTQGHLLTLDNDIAASKMNQSVTFGDDPRVALTKKYNEVTSPKVDTPYGAYSINDLRRFLAKEKDTPKPWEQTRIVEKAKNPEFEHSVYDADRLGIMGSYRWDVAKTPEGNLHFQSNDRWDINPWENRGKININNDALQEAERLKHFKSPLQNVEMLKVMGGKPFNIQNNFIVNPKDYSVMHKYQSGGQIFLQPNDPKLKKGYNVPDRHPSTELAKSIGGEKGEPAYLIPSFKQGHLLNDPIKEFNSTGEYLGGPFKTWQEADKWEKEVRHPYVEKGQSLPSPLKWWGDKYQSGGSIKPQVVPTQLDSSTYENNIKNNYQSFIKEHPSVNLPKGMENKDGMNCINGVCNFINGASGLELKNGNFATQVGKGKSYAGNATFNDNSEKEGFYRLNKEDISRDGFKPGDVVQYSKYKMNAHRFDGQVDSNNAFDLYPQHAKIIVDKYNKDGKTYYKILDNGGEKNYRTKDLEESELLTHFNKGYNAGLGHNYAGLIVHRYNPNEVTNRQNNRKIERDILKGVNPHAKEYDLESLPTYDFSQNDLIQGKIKTDKSQFADKLMDVYKKNYQRIGKSSNLPPTVLNKLAVAQIGIAGQESKFGTDEGTLKNLVPDALLDETRKLKKSVTSDENWIKDYYDKNSKDSSFKKQYPNYSNFEKHITDKYEDSGRGEYFYINSPRSKGVFQQKELSKTGNYLVKDKDLKDFDSQAIGSLALSIDNYHRLQKKYPKLTEDQLVDLTILSHNSPGKALVPEYVKYYLEHKDIDYVNKVKQNIPEYTETKNKKQLQKVEKDLSHHEVNSIKNFLATNTMIQKHRKGGRVLGLYEMMGMPIPFKSGGLIKGIGGALYGAVEGGLDAISMGLTDSITDQGANAIGHGDKTFNASRGAGNIAGAVAMDAITMGATHAGTVQQVAKGTNGLVQNTDIFGTNEKRNIGTGLDIFGAAVPLMGGIETGNVTASQVLSAAQGTGQALQNNHIQRQEQGGMNATTINVEGSGVQSGQKASMKKGELLTSNGMVLRNFINMPPHPTDPSLINPDGTVQAPTGTTVIPKNRTKEYMERDRKGKQQLEKSLISAQKLRERKEARMKNGGAVERYDEKTLVQGWGGNKPTPTGGLNINNSAFGSTAPLGATTTTETNPGVFSDMDPAMMALNLAPLAWNFGKGIFGKVQKYDPAEYMVNDRMKWKDLSNEQVQRKVNEGYNLGRYNMRNSGNYNLAGDVALGTNLMKTKAEEQEKIMNINSEGKFKADAANIDLIRSNMATKLGVNDINDKNAAMKADYLNKGFEGAGKLGAFGLQKDYMTDYMKKAYPRGYKKGGKVNGNK